MILTVLERISWFPDDLDDRRGLVVVVGSLSEEQLLYFACEERRPVLSKLSPMEPLLHSSCPSIVLSSWSNIPHRLLLLGKSSVGAFHSWPQSRRKGPREGEHQ